MIARLLYASCIVSVFIVALLLHLLLNLKRYLILSFLWAYRTVARLRALSVRLSPRVKARLPQAASLTACMAAMAALYVYVLYPQPSQRISSEQPDLAVYRLLPPNITRGSTHAMEVALTFDGGQYAGDTEEILHILKAKGIRTTIFLTGTFMKRHPELVRKMLSHGHEIGNHTMNHPHLTTYATNFTHQTREGVTKEFLERELKEAERLFYTITGRKMLPLWRAPYGEINEQILHWARELGYIHVGWTADYKRRQTLDTLDWVKDPSSRFYLTAEQIKERILSFGRGGHGLRGGIILMHLDTGRKEDRAIEKLEDIIDGLRQEGYRFVRVTELLRGVYTERVALKEAPFSP